MRDGFQPVDDRFGKLGELRGVPRCERFEEPGIGQGVPGKIGKDLFTHVEGGQVGTDCGESASVVGFGGVSDLVIGLSG